MNYFITISKKKFILLSLFIPFIYTSLLGLIFYFIKIESAHREKLLQNLPLIKIFFYKVILAPLVETFFFQLVILEIVMYVFNNKRKYFIGILISGLLFGLAHYTNTHNLIYSFLAVIAGSLFATIYVLSKIRKDVNPFLLVFLSHALINFFGFVINNVLN